MKYVVLLLLVGLSPAALAQAPEAASTAELPANVLSLNVPTGKPTNLRPQYERAISHRVGLGVRAAWYFGGDWPGWQAEAFGRYYFRPTAPVGFYGQAQVGAYRHRGQESSFYPMPQGPSRTYSATAISGPGVGLGLGYQLLLGSRKRLALDAMAGIKLYLQPFRGLCDCAYEGDWYDYGPGSIFNGRLAVGYAF